MIVTMSEQTLFFLYSCLLGVALSLYFDIFRVIRLVFGNPKIVTLVCDLVFFLSATLFTYLFFVQFCSGQIRVYVLAGEILGFLACHFSISAVFMKIVVFIVGLLRRFFRLLARPWVALGRQIGKNIRKRKQKAAEKKQKREKKAENSLQPHRKMVYNLVKLYRVKKSRGAAVREKDEDAQKG